jgi:hypothetical protein
MSGLAPRQLSWKPRTPHAIRMSINRRRTMDTRWVGTVTLILSLLCALYTTSLGGKP